MAAEKKLEEFQKFLDDLSELDREDYKELLYDITEECRSRLAAMDEDGFEEEE